MKSMLLIPLIFFFSLSLSSAQKLPIRVQWGKEFKASKKSTVEDVVGYDETGFYVLKGKYSVGFYSFNTDYSLEHFNKDATFIKSAPLQLRTNGRDEKLEFILQLKKELVLFSSFQDQQSKENELHMRALDKKTLKAAENKIKLASIDYGGKSKTNSGNYNVRLSRDSSKVLIFYTLPYKSGEPEKFGFHVYDAGMKEIWHQDITLPYKDRLFDIETFKVDNDGNVYLLGLLYKDVRKSKRWGDPNYEYKIFSYTGNGNSSNEYSVALPDKFLTDMQIEINDNNDIICAGFYSDHGTLSIHGTYFLTVDAKTKAIKSKSLKEFSIDFITQYMREGEAERVKRKEEKGKDVELYEYDLHNIILRDDGGAVLIGEQYFVKSYTYTTYVNGQAQTHSSTNYYFNDIIAVNINSKGTIEWASKVPKRQISAESSGFYCSYALAIVDDKIYFLFNDDPKNVDYDVSGRLKYFNGRESIVTMVEVNAQGKVTRYPLLNTFGLDVITRPKVCEQISDNEMILFGQRKKTQQFARLTFR